MDKNLSSRHFRTVLKDDAYFIEDLKSTNGTYLDGLEVRGRRPLFDRRIIRAGRCVFVYHSNAAPMLQTLPKRRFGMAGRFYTPALLHQLAEAALSERNILLSGDTGTGKELAAHAAAEMMCETPTPSPLL